MQVCGFLWLQPDPEKGHVSIPAMTVIVSSRGNTVPPPATAAPRPVSRAAPGAPTL